MGTLGRPGINKKWTLLGDGNARTNLPYTCYTRDIPSRCDRALRKASPQSEKPSDYKYHDDYADDVEDVHLLVLVQELLSQSIVMTPTHRAIDSCIAWLLNDE